MYILSATLYIRIMIYTCIFFKSHLSFAVSCGNQYSAMNFPSDGGRTIYFSLERDRAICRRFSFFPFLVSLLWGKRKKNWKLRLEFDFEPGSSRGIRDTRNHKDTVRSKWLCRSKVCKSPSSMTLTSVNLGFWSII